MRVAHRRALAQWTAISVAAAAAGAIVGRTRSGSEPLLVGVVALLTVLAHAAVTLARYSPRLARLTDQPVRVLVDDGRLCRPAATGLRPHRARPVRPVRRQRVYDLAGLRYVVYEAKGGLTVVLESTGGREGARVRCWWRGEGLEEAAGR